MTIKVWIATDKVRSEQEWEIEIDDEDLEDMSEDDKREYIDAEAYREAHEMMEWGWNYV